MNNTEPLASLLRPDSLDNFVGQQKLIGENKPLRKYLQSGKIPSMIFWGPPGVGKTTMAYIISKRIKADFTRMSGVTSKKADLQKIIQRAKVNNRMNTPTIVFLDEIHRWNKAQQDALLPYVEKGIIILIGATTENPSFTVNNALLSRCAVFVFESLSEQDIVDFIQKNMEKINHKYPEIIVGDEVIKQIAKLGNGDLRASLNILESACMLTGKGEIQTQEVIDAVNKTLRYDANGDEHYDVISAVHKSLRDSDPDAACYWIQRMLMGGEDPLYIVRRLIRFASEDIGPADNFALIMANNVYDAVHKIGMPECDVIIFHLAIYLAKAPKNNIAYRISHMTRADVQEHGNLPVPMHIRNAPTNLMKDLGYGQGYKYAHNFPDAKVDQQHFPDKLKNRKYDID